VADKPLLFSFFFPLEALGYEVCCNTFCPDGPVLKTHSDTWKIKYLSGVIKPMARELLGITMMDIDIFHVDELARLCKSH